MAEEKEKEKEKETEKEKERGGIGMEKEKEISGSEQSQKGKAWHSYFSDKLPSSSTLSTSTVDEAATNAIRSLHHHSSSHLRSFQGVVSETSSNYSRYEHAFFNHCKAGLATALEHPTTTAGITLAAVFLLAKGPRRFLLRNTVGRFQSEEARFVKAEKNVKTLNFSVDLMKKESRKLLERATLAEKEMTQGHTNLMNVGKQIRHLTKSVDQVQTQAADLVDLLREIPGREALRLRAEVASVASLIKQQRAGLAKRSAKLIELGFPV